MASCRVTAAAAPSGMTMKPRHVLLRPTSSPPRQRRPASIGRASAGKISTAMTATCARPAIRTGAAQPQRSGELSPHQSGRRSRNRRKAYEQNTKTAVTVQPSSSIRMDPLWGFDTAWQHTDAIVCGG